MKKYNAVYLMLAEHCTRVMIFIWLAIQANTDMDLLKIATGVEFLQSGLYLLIVRL